MENVTHTLAGDFLARAGLDRQTPHATAICILAANIPDIDLVTYSSPINYLNYHRHLTHSLFVVPAMGAVAVAAVALWIRLFRRNAQPVQWKSAWPIATVVALTHPLRDLMNPYGIRLWLPFKARWDGWDVVFIWEPWLWVWLFAAAIAVWLIRRRGPAMENTRAAARVAGFALAGLLAFIGLKSTLHGRAIEILSGLASHDEAVQKVAAFPHVFDPSQWTGVIETPGHYRVFALHGIGLVDSNEVSHPEPRIFPKFVPGEKVKPALESGLAADYLRFAQYAVGKIEPSGGGYVISLFDLRFGPEGDRRFICTIVLDRNYRKISESFQWR
jgi:inner membrane protein